MLALAIESLFVVVEIFVVAAETFFAVAETPVVLTPAEVSKL